MVIFLFINLNYMVNFYSQSLKEKEYGIGIDDEISLFIDVDRIKYIYMEC